MSLVTGEARWQMHLDSYTAWTGITLLLGPANAYQTHLEGPAMLVTGGVESTQMSSSWVWLTKPAWSVALSVSP